MSTANMHLALLFENATHSALACISIVSDTMSMGQFAWTYSQLNRKIA